MRLKVSHSSHIATGYYEQSNHVSNNCSIVWCNIVYMFFLPIIGMPIATSFYCPKIVGKEHAKFCHCMCIKMINLSFCCGKCRYIPIYVLFGRSFFDAYGEKISPVTRHKVQEIKARKNDPSLGCLWWQEGVKAAQHVFWGGVILLLQLSEIKYKLKFANTKITYGLSFTFAITRMRSGINFPFLKNLQFTPYTIHSVLVQHSL